MASYSKVIQIGNLTRDPEMKYTQAGKALCKFSLATNFKFGDQNEVCYIDVSFWEKSAENVSKFFKKGDPILVEGELRQENWEKDGQKHSKHVIRGTSWGFVGVKQDGGTGNSGGQTQQRPPAQQQTPAGQAPAPVQPGLDDDEIPF